MLSIDDPCHDLASFACEAAYNHQFHISGTYDMLEMDGEDAVNVRIIIDIVRGEALGSEKVALEIAGNIYSICSNEMYGKSLSFNLNK